MLTVVLIHCFFWLFATVPHVSSQTEFLNLDCGGIESYEDSRGMKWIPDDNFIKTGMPASVSKEHQPGTEKYLQTLRYFSDTSRKHCYTLPTIFNQTYILRAYFFYGNYDNLGALTVDVDLLIGATNFDSTSFRVNGSHYRYTEFVVKAAKETLDFCLASSLFSSSIAIFISAIQLISLQNGMYGLSDSSQGLIMSRRVNLGADSTDEIRYPQDDYDRIWRSDKAFPDLRNYASVNTTSFVSPGTTPDQPPSAVMSTAITSNGTIIFVFPAEILNDDCFFTFYFAEFRALGENTREFDLLLKNGSSLQNTVRLLRGSLNIESLVGEPLTSVEYHFFQPLHLSLPEFHLVPTKNSTLGPVLNAAELFLAKSNLSPGTEYRDKIAIMDIMSHFNISGWSGDPCLPVPYTWTWITCDTDLVPARITEIKLSNHHLNGSIPQFITDLKHLVRISFENNSLEGSIPDLSLLQNLSVLHLQDNNLTGRYPRQAELPPNLQELSLENNKLEGCPEYAKKINLSPTQCFSPTSNSSTRMIILITVPCAVVLALLLIVGATIYLKRKRSLASKSALEGAILYDPAESSGGSVKHFTYQEIAKSTNSFNTLIGKGSFGFVYYGRLLNGEEVAVKVLDENSRQGFHEFNSEVEILSVVHHKNVVRFIGYCTHKLKLILVYEFLANGTLKSHLYGTTHEILTWPTRMRIALDAAQGIDYLHNLCNKRIIHRDIKTSNILLSSTMVAKVTDFGLSKTYRKDDGSDVSTLVKGTRGYLDPEYHSFGRLTERSDVYSFGVVLLEIICGREPISVMVPDAQTSLTRWARDELVKGDLRKLVDPKLTSFNEQSAWKVLEVAIMCTEYDSARRPDMSTVVSELREAIVLENHELDS